MPPLAQPKTFAAELAFVVLDNFATQYNAAAYEKDPTRRNAILKGAEQLIDCRLRQARETKIFMTEEPLRHDGIATPISPSNPVSPQHG